MAFMTTMHTEDVALFSNPPYNTAEDKISWTQYHPSYANIGQEGYNSIHFNILGNATQYIDLSKTKLYVKLRIQKEDGSVWGADESGLPIDMILHTMWSSVDVTLNNIQVSGAGGNYMYKAAIEYLLNYSKNTKEIQLQSIGMTPDTANFDSVKPGDTAGGTLAINSGLLSRKALFGADGKGNCDFKGVLLADICNQGRLILDGVDVGITLWPTKNEFKLMSNVRCKLIIENIYLDVCKVQVNKYCMSGHKAALEIANGMYPLQKTVIIAKELYEGSRGQSWEDIFQGYVPSKMVIGMVHSTAFSGDFSKNPLRFQHFDIDSLGFTVNGEPTPKEAFQYDMEKNLFVDAFQSLSEITGKAWEDTDNGITKEMWKEGLALTAFDCDPTTANDFRYLGLPKRGHTRLTLKLKNSRRHAIMVIIYATFPGRVEIDDMRNVTLKGPQELEQQLIESAQKARALPKTVATAPPRITLTA